MIRLALALLLMVTVVSCDGGSPETEPGTPIPNTNTTTVAFAGLESVTSISSTKATLNWTDVAGVALYIVYDVTSGVSVYKSSVAAPANSIVLSGLTKGTSYTFRVRILDTVGLYDLNTYDLEITTENFSNNLSMQLGSPTYLDTGITTDLSGGGDFSISTWFKGSNVGYLVSQSHLVSYSSDFIVGGTGTDLFWMRSVGLGTKSDVEDGEWHHIVFVWNKTLEKYKGYVDGVLIGESASVSGYGGIGTSVIIGSRGDATTSFSDGLVDEVSIYSSALTDLDVVTLYNDGIAATPSSSNLVSWWRMGDDAGDDHTTLIDQESSNDITTSGMIPASLVEDAPNE